MIQTVDVDRVPQVEREEQGLHTGYLTFEQLNDKHVEAIVKQMFSRVKIKEPGDSTFTIGEVIERAVFFEENERLKRALKGSRLCLTTDTWTSIQNINYMSLTAH